MKKFYENEITLVPLTGMENAANRIKEYLKVISSDVNCEIVNVDLPRFATGDAKAVLSDSVRGKDIYILVDVGNYSCKYIMQGYENIMSPDEHFQDLIRTISAVGGKAARVNVIMPLLYGARQDRRLSRESLDCAVALQHLASIGVENIMSFDVHDDRVQNATPFMGFDNLMPTYQTLKALCYHYPDLIFDDENMAVVSPDFGGMGRNFAYANELGLDLGVFYKRRDTEKINNGNHAILVHKYIGPKLKGKDVIIVDDVIGTGASVLDSVKRIKRSGAKRIFVAPTFGVFSDGIKKFNDAYKNGLLEAVFITNASYVNEKVLGAPWYKEVNIMKYISYYVFCVNTGASISTILNPHLKISELISKYNNP